MNMVGHAVDYQGLVSEIVDGLANVPKECLPKFGQNQPLAEFDRKNGLNVDLVVGVCHCKSDLGLKQNIGYKNVLKCRRHGLRQKIRSNDQNG